MLKPTILLSLLLTSLLSSSAYAAPRGAQRAKVTQKQKIRSKTAQLKRLKKSFANGQRAIKRGKTFNFETNKFTPSNIERTDGHTLVYTKGKIETRQASKVLGFIPVSKTVKSAENGLLTAYKQGSLLTEKAQKHLDNSQNPSLQEATRAKEKSLYQSTMRQIEGIQRTAKINHYLIINKYETTPSGATSKRKELREK